MGLYIIYAKCPCFGSKYFTFTFQLCLEYLQQVPQVYKLGSQWYLAKQFPAKGHVVMGRQALPSLLQPFPDPSHNHPLSDADPAIAQPAYTKALLKHRLRLSTPGMQV